MKHRIGMFTLFPAPLTQHVQKGMSFFLLVIFSLCSATGSFSQPSQKSLTATRITEAPKIDGLLEDACWQHLPLATDFIQLEPDPGIPSRMKTEVKVVYDNSAIYIGAMMYDTAPDSILKELAPRDGGFNNADQFSVLLDTYHDDLNGFAFMVSASNVQTDVKFSEGGEEEDGNWNAVWESKTKITGNGWIAEIRIPYSAIRFPKKKEQDWGVHFMRVIRRHREMSFWSEVKPTEQNFIRQSGMLKGISDIEPPLRLSLSPYLSFGLDHYPYDIEGKSNYSYSFKGGMDLKYGLNEAFTLDMTLIPDFGQVKSDNKVLNLTPFEVRYDEHRPFFTEGTELFNKGGLFYSRRIGAAPSGYEDVEEKKESTERITDNPDKTQLINATKISGRNKNGLGIGFFNAMTANTYAKAEDTLTEKTRKILTQPFTNYNITVFDQILDNNSYISIINTNVSRFGGNRNANVSGLNFRMENKKNTYALSGNGALSQLFIKEDSAIKYDNETGHAYYLSFGKISGNFQFELVQTLESNTYDPNDLGFLYSNNEFTNVLVLSYNIFKPFWKILKSENSFGIEHNMLYLPLTYTNFKIFANTNTNWKNYLTNGLEAEFTPFESYDYYEPRADGKYFIRSPRMNLVYWYSSDYRKRLALDGHLVYGKWFGRGGEWSGFSVGPRVRVNNRLILQGSFFYEHSMDELGFAALESEDNIVFGKRKVAVIKNTFNTSYIFTNKMYVTMFAYHDWTRVEYFKYFLLQENGRLSGEYDYGGNANTNFNAFNIDLTYSWEFAPGSTMSIAWKNIIENEDAELLTNYMRDFSKTLDLPQDNSISIKILYYIDYQMLKRKRNL